MFLILCGVTHSIDCGNVTIMHASETQCIEIPDRSACLGKLCTVMTTYKTYSLNCLQGEFAAPTCNISTACTDGKQIV